MNLVLVGPCGVGKSAVGQVLADRLGKAYLDFDALRTKDQKDHPGQVSPFSVSCLDLRIALPPIFSQLSSGFVLDIGGDTVFRANQDNRDRFSQVLWFKRSYKFHLIILTATKKILVDRFISTKNRGVGDFAGVWDDWSKISLPYWLNCGDFFIDTSFLSIEQVRDRIISLGNLDRFLPSYP